MITIDLQHIMVVGRGLKLLMAMEFPRWSSLQMDHAS